MNPVFHLVDPKFVEASLHGELPFFRVLCGGFYSGERTTNDRRKVSCGVCASVYDNAEAVRLSQTLGQEDESMLDLSPLGEEGSLVAEYSAPPQIDDAQLLSRLALDPATDPLPAMGDPDLRKVISADERQAMATALGMVAGFPMAVPFVMPLLRAFYRICHRLAWLEAKR